MSFPFLVDTEFCQRPQFRPMRNVLRLTLLLTISTFAFGQNQSSLFVWAGDDAGKSSDFLAVIDADAASAHYGQVTASVAVPGPSGTPHHTELEMPEGGYLLANAFEAGRTTLFDLREPQHPAVVASFGDLDGLLFGEVLGVADGRDGGVEVAFYFVADVLLALLVFFSELAD